MDDDRFIEGRIGEDGTIDLVGLGMPAAMAEVAERVVGIFDG
jgi:hypothetical protein